MTANVYCESCIFWRYTRNENPMSKYGNCEKEHYETHGKGVNRKHVLVTEKETHQDNWCTYWENEEGETYNEDD